MTESVTKSGHKLRQFAIGFVAAALLIMGARALRYQNPHTHYHANFAIYMNGVRQELKDPSFYEEIASCSAADTRPQHRAHLHDNVNDVVHVHDKLVTWGAFLANIRFGAGDDYLATPTMLYAADETNKMHFWLNGKDISSPANKVIGDRDRLLISYGTEDVAAISKQYDTVAATATTVDSQKDPAACSGNEPVGWQSRLEALF